MAAIHRLLCTHCTFGSSELEHSTADNAAKVLGYSVRRSSLPEPDRGPLRTAFRGVERLLSYDVPKDTPPAKKESLEAATAPRRLVFLPNLGGWQAAAHVAYRTRDTHGRIGSYFADVLAVRLERDTRPWSPLDVLQLWSASHDGSPNAHWWCDSEELLAERDGDGRWKPADTASPSELRGSDESFIRDELLRQFLTLEPGEAVDDPGRIVSPRWWQMPASRRRDLLAALLQATIQSRKNGGKENAVVAAEPSVAALLFYGVFRLLPSKLRDGIGFSTYEAAPERPLTPLVGTTFLDGEASAADLAPDLSGRGFTCNTFRDPGKFGRTTPPAADGFVHRAIDLATRDDGWEQLDGVLDAIDRLPRPDFRNLDELARIDAFITRYVTGSDKLDKLEPEPPASPGSDGEKYRRIRFKQLVEQRARHHGGDWPRDLLRSCIRWVGDDFTEFWQAGGPIADTLRSRMPDDDNGLAKVLDALKGIRDVPPDFVAETVVRVALTTSPTALPPSFAKFISGDLGKDISRGGRPRADAPALVQAVLERLATENRQDVITALDRAFVEPVLDAVAAWEKSQPGRWMELCLPLLPLVERELTVRRTSPQDRAEFLSRYDALAPALAAAGTTPALSQAIDDFLREILQFTRNTPPPPPGQRLSADGQSRTEVFDRWLCLATPELAPHFRERLTAWKEVHQTIGRLRGPAESAGRSAKCPIPLPKFAQAYRALTHNHPIESKTPKDAMKVFLSRSLDGMKVDAKSPARETIVRWLVACLPDELDSVPLRGPTHSHLAHESDDNDRYFPPPETENRRGRGRLGRTLRWKYVAIGASVVLVMGVGGLVAWQYHRLPKETAEPESRQSATTTAVAQKPPPTPAPVESARNSDVPNTTDPQATQPNAPASPQPSEKPIALDSLSFQAKLKEGKIEVTWNTRGLEEADLSVEISPLQQKGDDFPKPYTTQIPDVASGTMTWAPQIPPDGSAFGKYNLRLIAKRKNQKPVESPAHPISIDPPPEPQVTGVQLLVEDEKPSLRLHVKAPTKSDLMKYGACKAVLSIPGFPDSSIDFAEPVSFPLPQQLTPKKILDEQSQFLFCVSTPFGSSPKCALPSVMPGDIAKEISDRLKQKEILGVPYTCPLSDTFEKGRTLPLLELPWWFVSAGMKDFNLQLLPSGHSGQDVSDQILLTESSSAAEHLKRWECKSNDVHIGFFEIHQAKSNSWKSQLRFVTSSQDNADLRKAYERLRTCKLCFSVKDTPFCTVQLIAPIAMGPIVLSMPKTLSDKMPPVAATTTLPPQWFDLNLYQRLSFEKHTLEKEPGRITISREDPEQKNVAVLAASQGDNAIRATLNMNLSQNKKDLMLQIHQWKWIQKKKSEPIDRAFLDALRRKKSLDTLEASIAQKTKELEALKDNPGKKAQKQLELDDAHSKKKERVAEQQKKNDEDCLPCLALLDALAGERIEFSNWTLHWKVQASSDSNNKLAEIPGGLIVVGAIGSRAGLPAITLEPKPEPSKK